MIPAWMAYALLVSFLAAGTAVVLESLLRDHKLPTRWVWLGAMAFSALWPVWAAFRPEMALGSFVPGGVSVVAMEPLGLQVGSRSVWHSLEVPVVIAWIGSSLVLAILGLGLLSWTRLLRRRWMDGEAGGRPILLSEDWGPAVVGFFNPQIVLPRWCQALESDELRLILDHEVEHLRAGDLRLLILAGLPPVLLPWSLPLWWMWHRLRLAVEGDCDLRVLRRNPGATREYLELLLEVGRRLPDCRVAAAMLSEPERTLERRIKIMTMPFPKKPILRGAILVSVGVVLVAVACLAPTPTAVEDEGRVMPEQVLSEAPKSDLEKGPVFTPFTVRPDIKNRSEILQALEANYPPLLREAGITGTATVWFFLDETGTVQKVQINESSGHPALDDAALRVGEVIAFTPALDHEDPVPVWISLPITFTTK